MKLRSVLTTVAVLALTAATPALADKGGNGNGGGNGKGNGGGNTHASASNHTTSVSAKSTSKGSNDFYCLNAFLDRFETRRHLNYWWGVRLDREGRTVANKGAIF